MLRPPPPLLTLSLLLLPTLLPRPALAYWEAASSVPSTNQPPPGPQISRFVFPKFYRVSDNIYHGKWSPGQAVRVCGISYYRLNLSTGTIITKRALLTAANFLVPYRDDEKSLRVWCHDQWGHHAMPQRYRVWRVLRVVPKSASAEHSITRFGTHNLRHDLAIVQLFDTIPLNGIDSTIGRPVACTMATRWQNPPTVPRHHICRIIGLGYESIEELTANYKIANRNLSTVNTVDCKEFLPEGWGYFWCLRNVEVLYGLSNGASFFCGWYLSTYFYAVGSFEIRYNEDRILVFTDVRPYTDKVMSMAYLENKEYYDYALQEFHYRERWPDLHQIYGI